ncbi:MAG TPA: retropepsin-like aspartic protease [Thermoanaerobaculia bacterium]|nr:retropepsin-like aspartic protease [Thermoanaerobaculia bacterium]
MKIRLEDRLPFVTVKLGRGTEEIVLERVLLDTGSAATVFAVDEIATLGIVPEHTDRIRRMVGIGGVEFVLAKRIESLALGEIKVRDFPIQIWAMKYGFPIQGLLGTDFFVQAQVILDLDALEVYSGPRDRS